MRSLRFLGERTLDFISYRKDRVTADEFRLWLDMVLTPHCVFILIHGYLFAVSGNSSAGDCSYDYANDYCLYAVKSPHIRLCGQADKLSQPREFIFSLRCHVISDPVSTRSFSLSSTFLYHI